MVRYVTRWALTSGIKKFEGEMSCGYFCGRCNGGYYTSFYATEAFETLDEAIQDAKRRAAKKVEALQKQIKKFSDPNWTPKLPVGEK